MSRTKRPVSSKVRSKRSNSLWAKLSKWQVVLGAVIAALIAAGASIWAAYVSQGGGHASSAPSSAPVKVTITDWSQQPLTTGGVQYVFHGIVTGKDWQEIYVILQSNSLPAEQAMSMSRPWSVSPPATVTGNGQWTIIWDLPAAPIHANWTAVAMAYFSCGGNGVECDEAPLDEQAANNGASAGITSTSTLPSAGPSRLIKPVSPCPSNGCSGLITSGLTPSGSTPPVIAQFTNLHQGSTVSVTQQVAGRVEHIPNGMEIWLVIYQVAGPSYWPQPGPLLVDPHGQFHALAYFWVERGHKQRGAVHPADR